MNILDIKDVMGDRKEQSFAMQDYISHENLQCTRRKISDSFINHRTVPTKILNRATISFVEFEISKSLNVTTSRILKFNRHK